ncbi:hypothetical protein VP14_182 [Vibrio phage VPMCC14]|nr:hypothetical protein VP14_182 [Vibrio phage VPMCC14]
MKIVELWKNTETGKDYQVRQYEDKEVWVNLGIGWFKSELYTVDDIKVSKDFVKVN